MYLVELKPGKEELYRTGDELALAIRDGDVDSRSRIYHRATAKWISITLHPQYKAIVAGQKDEQAPRPARKAWGLLPTSHNGVSEERTPTETAPSNGTIRHRWKRPMGFGLAGMLLLLGVQLAFSGPRPPWSGRSKPVAIARPQERVIERAEMPVRPRELTELVSLASSAPAWPVEEPTPPEPVAPQPTPPAKAAPIHPRAPKLRTKALRAALAPGSSAKSAKANSVQDLLNRYEAASDEARARLESGIRVARLTRLFAPARLTPGGGVTDTRLSLAGAANFIRVFRQQQAAIDKAYQDSVTVLAKRHKWSSKDVKQWHSRAPRQESPTLQLLNGSLMGGIDSLLGVLDAQAGAYKLRGTAIAFEDPAATLAYGVLRRKIKEQIDAAVAAGAATTFGPTGMLLQAIGTSTLPRET
ncbi:MAG TPA: hypothetical protein VFO71_08915 [Gemmatimonadales bacterium]|nr:hypothetical protein [Gemmatimonadales bacterium]